MSIIKRLRFNQTNLLGEELERLRTENEILKAALNFSSIMFYEDYTISRPSFAHLVGLLNHVIDGLKIDYAKLFEDECDTHNKRMGVIRMLKEDSLFDDKGIDLFICFCYEKDKKCYIELSKFYPDETRKFELELV